MARLWDVGKTEPSVSPTVILLHTPFVLVGVFNRDGEGVSAEMTELSPAARQDRADQSREGEPDRGDAAGRGNNSQRGDCKTGRALTAAAVQLPNGKKATARAVAFKQLGSWTVGRKAERRQMQPGKEGRQLKAKRRQPGSCLLSLAAHVHTAAP